MPKYQRKRVPVEPLAYPVNRWCALVSLSPSYAYELMGNGTIESVKIGGKRLITTPPRTFLDRFKTA